MMETKKESNRLVFAVVAVAVVLGLYWSAYENESNLTKDDEYFKGELTRNNSALPYMMDSFQQSQTNNEVKVVEVNEIGKPLSLDFFPEEKVGVPDVNLGRVMDVNEAVQSDEPLVQIGSIMSVESLPLDTGNTVAVNLGEVLNADDYYGKGTPAGGTVNKGKPMDADEYLKQQDESPSNG